MESNKTAKVYDISGELTLEDTMELKALIGEGIKKGACKVVFNLENVTHIHLAGLSVLVDRAKRLKDYGGDLKLAGLSNYLENVLALTGYKDRFNCYKSVDEAMKSF